MFNKHIIFLFCILVFSCATYEPLKIYKAGFVINIGCIKTNGYYVREILPEEEFGLTKKHFHPIYFYNDGSFAYDSYYDDSYKIKESIINYPDMSINWGFYECQENKVYAEFIHQYNPLDFKRASIKFNIVEDTLISKLGHKYVFVPFEHKPDSSKNWLKTHRKYRID